MKIRCIQLLGLLCVAALSSTAFAGGEGCDSNKKGSHKELSAEALQNLGKNHSWLKHHGSKEAEGSAGHDKKVIKEHNSTSGLIES